MVILPLFFNFVILPLRFQTKRDFNPALWSLSTGVNFWTKDNFAHYVFTPVLFWYLCFYPYFRINKLTYLTHNF